MGTATKLITADEYLHLSEADGPSELIEGVIVPMSPTGFEHGIVCDNISDIFKDFRRGRSLGRLMGGELGVWTIRNPDSVRGVDWAYFTPEQLQLSRGERGFVRISPVVVIEVHSPGVAWKYDLEKMDEYLRSGVLASCLVDFERRKVHVYRPGAEQVFRDHDVVPLPEIHPDFQLPLDQVFFSL